MLEVCVTALLWLNVFQVNSICWASVNYPDSHVLYPSSALIVLLVSLHVLNLKCCLDTACIFLD